MDSERKPLVLVVDDQPQGMMPLIRMLGVAGMEVDIAKNGAEALHAIAERVPDLVVLDFVLEQESGIDVFKSLKQNPALESTAVLFLSGGSEVETKIAGINLGATDFILKGSDFREIIARIELQARLARSRRELARSNKDLTDAYDKLRVTQELVVRTEKMATLGRVAASVVHEISTPMSFVGSNTRMVRESVEDVFKVVDAAHRLAQACIGGDTPPAMARELATGLLALEKELNLESLRTEISSMCRESMEGIEMLIRIMNDLREFSRDDYRDLSSEDFNTLIMKAVTITQGGVGGRIAFEKELDVIPRIECVSVRIVQLFVILLMNAIQSIKDRGVITIKTCYCNGVVTAVIADTGCGIPAENIEKVFEPFFTTKTDSQGTGLGLTIARKITDFHGGSISIASEPGRGTEVTVIIPEFSRGKPLSSGDALPGMEQ